MSVVYTTTAKEFNTLLNDANNYTLSQSIISELQDNNRMLKQQLASIGRHVYETDGRYGVWSTASDRADSNDSLKYAKSLSESIL